MMLNLNEIWMGRRDVGIPPTVNEASYVDCLGLENRGREGQEGVGRKYGVDVLVVVVGMLEEIPTSQFLNATYLLPFSDYVRRSFVPREAVDRYHSLSREGLEVPSSDQRMIYYSMILPVILLSYLLNLSFHHLP
jgi:hypothetical protein